MRSSAVLVALLSLTYMSSPPAAAGPEAPDVGGPKSGDPTERDAERLRSTYVVVEPQSNHTTISKILFVERCVGGCVLNPGPSDARTNTTTLVNQQRTLSEFGHGDQVWDDTIDCLREVYAPYDVEVTTDDPGEELFHHKAILAGTAQQAGFPAGVGGVANLAGDCSPLNNEISLSFANSLRPDWIELCWTVAQESAHAFGLDHAFDCSDPMTYLPGCGQKFFRNRELPCGGDFERLCRCTGAAQNSHRKLTQVFGEGTLPPPPTVSISLPTDGATVSNGFPVILTAQQKRGLDRVELWLNGWLWATREGALTPDTQGFTISTSTSLPDGYIDIEVVAYNDLGVPEWTELTVLKGSPCTSADQCAVGQLCENGRCFWETPTAVLGDSCDFDQQCVSLTCVEHAGDRLCSESCFPGVNNLCPSGFDCLAAGEAGLCWPEGGSAGCCSVGRDQGVPWSLGIYLALIALVWRPRRRAAG
jgi:hypothetical protein